MAARETPLEQIDRLLGAGDHAGAARVAGEMIAKLPNSPLARIRRCQAYAHMGMFAEAEIDLEVALRAAPKDELANYLRGQFDLHAGRDAAGIERLKPIALGRGPCALEAMFAVLDMCYHSARRDEWKELLRTEGAWRNDPRAGLHAARLDATVDPLAGVETFTKYLRSGAPRDLRRHAGFEAAGILDKAGEYRRAFDLARETHTTTSEDFDLDVHVRPLLEQVARIEKGENWIKPTVERVQGVAMLVSLPRSGTTLLEQMLDRHPAISGIGEYEGLSRVCRQLQSQPAWPRRPEAVPASFYTDMQRLYLDGTKRLRRPDAVWTFDKGIRTWRSLPEVAAVLPGAKCIDVRRDARDTATSLFLSYFSTDQIGWTRSLESIRRTIEIERRLVPRALDVLGIEHTSIQYESLVDDPAREARRCLALLGLELDERVLSPEQNTKAAVTVSAMQVRKPINRSSIGRWRNYEFAFGPEWDSLS